MAMMNNKRVGWYPDNADTCKSPVFITQIANGKRHACIFVALPSASLNNNGNGKMESVKVDLRAESYGEAETQYSSKLLVR